MNTMLLSYGKNSEVGDLTGAHQRPRQIKALSAMGIRFFVGIDGWPRVTRVEIERPFIAPLAELTPESPAEVVKE